MTVRAFDITFKDEAVQTVNLKAGTWTFHAFVNALTYSIGLKDSTGVWHNYDLSDQTGTGWYDVQETITTDFDAVEISLLNNVGTAQVLFPMFEKGSRKSVKRPHEKDIEEAAIIKSASWEIHTSSPVIYKDAPDLTTDGAHTPVTVTGRHWVGSTMTEEGFLTVTANDEIEASNASPSPVTIAPLNNADKHTYTIRLYSDANKTELLDYETIPVVFKGAKGISAIRLHINNPVDVLPADSDGNVLSFTGTGTSIHVFEGAVELDYDGIGTANGKFKVTAVPFNITMGAITDSGNVCVVADATAMAAEKASIVYTVTGKTLDGFDFTVSGEQNFTKTKMGQDGEGILSVMDYYGLSTSASVLPSTWYTTVPSKAANQFLWNYERIIYTDTTYDETQKRIIQGNDARSIYDIKNAYAYSESDTVSPISGWQWSIAALGTKPAGYFLWIREDIAYTDNPSNYISTIGYVVRDGEPGLPGDPGTGVDGLRTEYYLSSSSTTQTGGTWQTTVPVWVAGTYIWERIVTVMSDLTEVIGTPYLSRTWETINQLQADANKVKAITDKFGTTTDGGLIQTVMMLLRELNSTQETAGVSGIQGALKNNPAFWAGGSYARALALIEFLSKMSDGTTPSAGEYSNLAKITMLHNGAAKIGDFIIEESGRIVLVDPTTGKPRLVFGISDIPIISELVDGTFQGTSVSNVANLGIPVGTTFLTNTINVTTGGADVSFSASSLRLIYNLPNGYVHVATIEVGLYRDNQLVEVMGYIERSGAGIGTDEIAINKVYTGMPTGVYKVGITYHKTTYAGSSFNAQISGSTLGWSWEPAEIRYFQFGVNGMMAFFSNNHWYFTELDGFDLRGKTNMPGVLLSGTVAAGGGIASAWGAKQSASNPVNNSTGRYTVYHSVGHANYQINAVANTASKTCHIVSKGTTNFVVEWRTVASTPSLVNTGFDFQIIGNNYE